MVQAILKPNDASGPVQSSLRACTTDLRTLGGTRGFAERTMNMNNAPISYSPVPGQPVKVSVVIPNQVLDTIIDRMEPELTRPMTMTQVVAEIERITNNRYVSLQIDDDFPIAPNGMRRRTVRAYFFIDNGKNCAQVEAKSMPELLEAVRKRVAPMTVHDAEAQIKTFVDHVEFLHSSRFGWTCAVHVRDKSLTIDAVDLASLVRAVKAAIGGAA